MIGKCDVCGKTEEIYVCASTMGAVSLGYCKYCLQKGLEPYGVVVAYIACAGHFPEDINKMYQDHVRRILNGLGVSEEQFIKDVDKCLNEMVEDINSMYN